MELYLTSVFKNNGLGVQVEVALDDDTTPIHFVHRVFIYDLNRWDHEWNYFRMIGSFEDPVDPDNNDLDLNGFASREEVEEWAESLLNRLTK